MGMLEGDVDFAVASAGTNAVEGLPASTHAALAVQSEGACLKKFRSQPLTGELAGRADAIFVMTQMHRDLILAFFPEAAEKTYLLTQFQEGAERGKDIPDPIGQGPAVYARCRDKIRAALPSVYDFIRKNL